MLNTRTQNGVLRDRRELQVINQPHNDALPNSSLESKTKTQKELVETLRVQWKLLWSERFNDKIRAEGISKKDYRTVLFNQTSTLEAGTSS